MPQVHVYHDLDAVAADARGALDRAARASLFDRLDWFRLTLAHCPPPGRPLVLRAGGSWLFLMLDGTTARPLASWYSLRFGAIGGSVPGELAAIARHLRRHAAHLVLEPLDDWSALASAFSQGWRCAATAKTVNRQVAVRDWPSYWSARPARLRETVRRKSRGDPFRIVILDRFDARAWAAYEAVYARSWKPAEGSPAFLRALAGQEGEAGTLRLGLAWDGARPVAAQLWLVEHGRATIHKLAHDAADGARSPGTLLGHAMFRRAIDFGTGDDACKADWMDDARLLWRLYAWNLAHPPSLTLHLHDGLAKLVRRTRTR